MKLRTLWGLLLVAMVSLLFTGCGSDDNDGDVFINNTGIDPYYVRINNTGTPFQDTVRFFRVTVSDASTGTVLSQQVVDRNFINGSQNIVVATGRTGNQTVVVEALDANRQPLASASQAFVAGTQGGTVTFAGNNFVTGTPTPTPTPTPTATPTPSVPPTGSPTPSPAGSPGASPSASASPGASPSASASPGASPTASASPGASPSASASPGASPSASASPGASPSASASPGASPTASASPGASPTASASPGASPRTSP